VPPVTATPGSIGQAQTVAGVLAGGSAGIETLHEAVERLERSPARWELARSLVDLGGALRRDGQRVEAREALRRALDPERAADRRAGSRGRQ